MYVIVREAERTLLPMRVGGSFHRGKVHRFRSWESAQRALRTLPRRGKVSGGGFAAARYTVAPADSIRGQNFHNDG